MEKNGDHEIPVSRLQKQGQLMKADLTEHNHLARSILGSVTWLHHVATQASYFQWALRSKTFHVTLKKSRIVIPEALQQDIPHFPQENTHVRANWSDLQMVDSKIPSQWISTLDLAAHSAGNVQNKLESISSPSLSSVTESFLSRWASQ